MPTPFNLDEFQVYPKGHSSASGYTSIFIGLVQGSNDASLSWPFLNRYVRLMIVDQNPDAKYALNRYAGFLTEDANTWKQPVNWIIHLLILYRLFSPYNTEKLYPILLQASSGNSFSGYPFFITINDLSSSLNFLKGGRLIISILVMDEGGTYVARYSLKSKDFVVSCPFVRNSLPSKNI